MPRSYNAAIEALNSLQTNFATIQAIRSAGNRPNLLAIPQMIEWSRRAGIEPKQLNSLNVIHITGTKGKGSTCAFVRSILEEYQTPGSSVIGDIGLYTSPHLKTVRERIQVNHLPISKDQFAHYFFDLWDRLVRSQTADKPVSSVHGQITESQELDMPNYFRYLTLLSFHVFLSESVDTAIYEVGVGGEYDSTNIVPKPSVTGVSSLGLDHTALLGNTIEEIAWNKGGIYKHGVPAYSVRQVPESALNVLRSRAEEKEASFFKVVDIHKDIPHIKLGLDGDFQKTNAALAVELVAQHLRNRGVDVDLSGSLPMKFVDGLEKASWPGRCQTLKIGNVTYLLDGAHTEESLTLATKWFNSTTHSNKKKVLVFNQQTRDAKKLLRLLHSTLDNQNAFDNVIFTTNVTYASGSYAADLKSVNNSADDVTHLTVQKELADVWRSLNTTASVNVLSSLEETVKLINTLGPCEVFVTGSLHLVGGMLSLLEGE